MEDRKMITRTTDNTTHRRSGASFPEEEAILARFWTRVSSGAHKTLDAHSHGSFLVL
jgi:hypothetical protein